MSEFFGVLSIECPYSNGGFGVCTKTGVFPATVTRQQVFDELLAGAKRDGDFSERARFKVVFFSIESNQLAGGAR